MKSNEGSQDIINFLTENVTDLEVVLIINPEGNLLKNYVSKKLEKNYKSSWLQFFSMMISLRFPMSGFNKQLKGLKLTLNVFQDKSVIVKLLKNGNFLAVIIPWKTNSVVNALNIMSDENFQ